VRRVGLNLKRGRSCHSVVVVRGGCEDIVAAEIHDQKFVVADEADAVGSGREFVPVDVECDVGDEVGLISLLNGSGVSAGIDLHGEHQRTAREMHTAGVALLRGCGLALKVDRGGNQCVEISGMQDRVRGAGSGGLWRRLSECFCVFQRQRGDQQESKQTKAGYSHARLFRIVPGMAMLSSWQRWNPLYSGASVFVAITYL
jgi:hypothetical protein